MVLLQDAHTTKSVYLVSKDKHLSRLADVVAIFRSKSGSRGLMNVIPKKQMQQICSSQTL